MLNSDVTHFSLKDIFEIITLIETSLHILHSNKLTKIILSLFNFRNYSWLEKRECEPRTPPKDPPPPLLRKTRPPQTCEAFRKAPWILQEPMVKSSDSSKYEFTGQPYTLNLLECWQSCYYIGEKKSRVPIVAHP